MALLPILRFPDPRLKKVAALVTRIDEGTRKLVADMAETMYEAPGIGLAATQVDVHKQVVVIERHPDVGGGCTHWGTIPSKALRHAVSRLVEFNNVHVF